MARQLYEVPESEEVARILFSPSMVSEGRISRNAFFLERLSSGRWEDYLSVWRTLYKLPSRENVTFPPRKAGDEAYGYATLTVATIHAQDIFDCTARVKNLVKDATHYHVGIFYQLSAKPVVGQCDDPAFMALTMALANRATLHIFPPIGG
jgi:hypothetical protein